MLADLSLFHDGCVNGCQMWTCTKLKFELSPVLGLDAHGLVVTRHHRNFVNVSIWYAAAIEYLLGDLSPSILDEPDSIVAYHKSTEYRATIGPAARTAAFSLDVKYLSDFLTWL